ncbi:hypothetical protein EJB05_26763, partial [Eragrostis curvula]
MKNENVRSSSTGQKFAHTLLQWTGANCLMTGVSFSTNFERRKKRLFTEAKQFALLPHLMLLSSVELSQLPLFPALFRDKISFQHLHNLRHCRTSIRFQLGAKECYLDNLLQLFEDIGSLDITVYDLGIAVLMKHERGQLTYHSRMEDLTKSLEYSRLRTEAR